MFFYLSYLISLTHLRFIAFLSLYYIVLIGVLIYSAAQLQECLINLLTYLLTGTDEQFSQVYVTRCRRWLLLE